MCREKPSQNLGAHSQRGVQAEEGRPRQEADLARLIPASAEKKGEDGVTVSEWGGDSW